MRVLVIGGTRFIGFYTVRRLIEQGHEVMLFHRGQTVSTLPDGVSRLLGDRRELAGYRSELAAWGPDVVLDMVPYTEQDARTVMQTFQGIAARVVAISSCDVYRAFGRLHGLEDGAVEQGPLTEDAPLRERLFAYRGKRNGPDDYEKILVERVVMGDPELPGTVLRLPAVYGPHDYQHRMYFFLRRMLDKRPAILLEEGLPEWRWTRGYVENVADAIALAVSDGRAAGRIYNVGEPAAMSMREWIQAIAQAVGWSGEIVSVPADRLPEALRWNIHAAQHIVCDSSSMRRELGYQERISLEESIRRTVEWESLHPPENGSSALSDYAAEDAVLASL
ncbi:NAD-dependent epimerase/dehydratase family protein [Brevibacillus sp. SYP-B805]|uniref:NAD-dependent epimerase/dehydratase family protein n=1 Tax=Brevibacillus sp. SYP-B805 TaxID=1578199 RepID=UPI0013EC6308|nr:NAD-dependent epimerase/dehydratase family protein [Brevibacillus sp. SYP-B805]NGQ95955.1 NAD-dependent epimerase/dehydratase family protein [Brevibacillus sp. SYP-B805]